MVSNRDLSHVARTVDRLVGVADRSFLRFPLLNLYRGSVCKG